VANQREGVIVTNGAITVLPVTVSGTGRATGMQPLPMPAAQVIQGAILVKLV
jgi:hypothetical protein